jgi:predicted flavoprotein YhiN
MFAGIHAPKNAKKCILEKTGKLGTKVLMSGGERCNVSNIDIEPERDYFGHNTKAMYSALKQFSNYDMISWLETLGVQTQIEDR